MISKSCLGLGVRKQSEKVGAFVRIHARRPPLVLVMSDELVLIGEAVSDSVAGFRYSCPVCRWTSGNKLQHEVSRECLRLLEMDFEQPL